MNGVTLLKENRWTHTQKATSLLSEIINLRECFYGLLETGILKKFFLNFHVQPHCRSKMYCRLGAGQRSLNCNLWTLRGSLYPQDSSPSKPSPSPTTRTDMKRQKKWEACIFKAFVLCLFFLSFSLSQFICPGYKHPRLALRVSGRTSREDGAKPHARAVYPAWLHISTTWELSDF